MLLPLGFLVLVLACLAAVFWGGRLVASISGALVLGPISFGAVGFALAGHLNPQSTRFQNFPVDAISDAALLTNLGFWMALWGVSLYFLLPRLGARWR